MAFGAIASLIGSALSAQSNTGNKESEKTSNVASSDSVNSGYSTPAINNAEVKSVESDKGSEKMDWNSIGRLADELESAYSKQSAPLVQSTNVAGR